MVTVWLGQYVHNPNPQGSCEYDEADMVKKKKKKKKARERHLVDITFVTPCLSFSRDRNDSVAEVHRGGMYRRLHSIMEWQRVKMEVMNGNLPHPHRKLAFQMKCCSAVKGRGCESCLALIKKRI